MKEYYSRANPNEILYSLLRIDEISQSRQDLSKESEFIQVNARKFSFDVFIKPHKHLQRNSNINLTQECWIVIKGSIKAQIFDLDDSLFSEEIINDGDCIVFFRGGHSLRVLKKNSIMYEIKNGPYLGLKNDKTSI